jgi:predicted RNA-binding Zn-ribbon protein involved in translation (DUF1610 family)
MRVRSPAMNKTVVILIAFVLAAGFFVFRLKSSTGYDIHSLDKIPQHLKCLECGAESTYSNDQLKDFVRAGKIAEVQYQVRRFPCSKCGKIAAVAALGKSNENATN